MDTPGRGRPNFLFICCDHLGVLVRYDNRAIMTYSLNAYLPWEGFRVNFNGTKGRMELEVVEASYVNAGGDRNAEGAVVGNKLIVYPMFGKPYKVQIPEAKGGHGGGDQIMLNDVFTERAKDPLKRAASHLDGAMSILTGIAANKSMNTGMPVVVKDLVRF